MKVLITAGPTYEPIDPVRFIGNRSSGRMGAALAEAALDAGHTVTAIVGPVSTSFPPKARRADVQTAAEMRKAVLREFPSHDLLIMAAAVADFRPKLVRAEKIHRSGNLLIECEPTEDIVTEAARLKLNHQRIIGFSLEAGGQEGLARDKLVRKKLDLIVYNPLDTLNSSNVSATLLWPDGRVEMLNSQSKRDFAQLLVDLAGALFGS